MHLFAKNYFQPFSDHYSDHIETSQLICSANQLIGLYMMGALVVKGLRHNSFILERGLTEAFVGRCSSKYVFLKILQISQENTYVGNLL